MASHEILDKLFDVEKKAETIVASAQEEADRRVAAAKEAAEASFKAAYEAKGSELEAGLSAARQGADSEFRSELERYRAALAQAGEHEASFSALCDKLLSDGRA
jgi:V/A-type H+-transporting ATPase subunit G/H